MKIEKVNVNKNGGCYNCKDSYWDENTSDLKYTNEEVNSFKVGNNVIRLCDTCLDELRNSITSFQRENEEKLKKICFYCENSGVDESDKLICGISDSIVDDNFICSDFS